MALGSTSIIYFPPSRFYSESEFTSNSKYFSSTTRNIIRCCSKGFYGIHTTFPFPSLTSHYPSCVASWNGCPESGHIFFVSFFVGWGHLFPASTVRSLHIQTLSSST
jgi:hypothetical protein